MPKSIIYIVILVPLVFSLVIVNSAQASQRSATQTVTGTGRTCAAAERDARSKLKSGRDICTDACVPKGLFCEYGCSRVSPVGMPNDVGTCTQNDDGSFTAKIDRAMLCNYTCRSSSSGRAPSAQPQQPQAAETTQPNLLQRLSQRIFGGDKNDVVVDLQPAPQQISSTYIHRGDGSTPPASNPTSRPRTFTMDVYQKGEYILTGEGTIPAGARNAQVKLVSEKLPPDAIVTYRMVDGANGQAGFVTANLVETYSKLLKGLFGDNNGTTMEIKTPKKGLQFTYSITSQDPNEPLNVTFDGKKQKVREIKESILVDTLTTKTTNYNLTFDGLSVLRGGDEVAKVLALLFSGGASLLVQWIPAPEKSQEPTTGGTSGGGTSGGEPPTGGVPPRGRCRPSELGGSDLERTWRQRGHDLISSCSWVNSGHDLEGSFNTETWGPGHNFGQSKLSAPDGWSPVD